MGGGGSKSYTPEKLDDHSGIDFAPHKFSTWWKEVTYADGNRRYEERLISERQTQIEDQFSEKKVQAEYDTFRALWADDGEYTKAYATEGFTTSEQWPESVKAVTSEKLQTAFKGFRVNNNAVLRIYQQFREDHGAVSVPQAYEGGGGGRGNKPRCAEKHGTCPEWNKSFQHQFEGDIPPDIRDLDGEALDRFHRYMLMKSKRQETDKFETFTDFIPVVGTIVRTSECASEKDPDRKDTQCHAAGINATVDALTFGIGPAVRVVGNVGRGARALAGGARLAAPEAAGYARLAAEEVEMARLAAPEAAGVARMEGGEARLLAPEVFEGAEATAIVSRPVTKTAAKAAATLGMAAVGSKLMVDNDLYEVEPPQVEAPKVLPEVHTEPPKSHLPDDSVQYHHDLVHEQPDDRYTIDVTAGSQERQGDPMLGVVVLLLAGGAVYYAYRKLT